MARLSAATWVVNPETSTAEYLAAGSELPEWATGLVGEHALAPEVDDETKSDEPKPARRQAAK